MTTPYAGFFSKAILGASILEDNIFGAARQTVRDLGGQIIGECVVDSSNVGLGISASADALNDRRLTVTGDLPALDDSGRVYPNSGSDSDQELLTEGSRVITVHDPDWYSDLPYENDSGTTYRVYLTMTSFPIDVDIASDGSRGYSRLIDAPGITLTPNSIVDTGTYLEIRIGAALTAFGVQEWLTANDDDPDWSYDCVVYLSTETPGVIIAVDDPDVAIAFGAKLVKRAAGGWMVKLDGIGDGYLGQADPSLTSGHYRVAVLGPVVTTTDFDSNPAYVHVGTVLSGVSETVDTTQQKVVNSISQSLVDASAVPDALLTRGWVTRPTVTFGASDVTFGTGEAFVSGSVHDTAGEVVGSLSASSTLYLYWDDTTDGYLFSASFATANLVGRVPIARVETDGAGAITLGHVIGRVVKEFNDSYVLTVSSNANHRCMFTTVKEALAWAAARNTIEVGDPSYVIELVGTAVISETISDADLVGVPNVVFRGRIGGQSGAGSTAVTSDPSRIFWSMDDPLFTVPAGATMRNWRFERIIFQCGVAGTAADTAVVNNQGDIEGLQFVECHVDGNDFDGASSPYLPHVVYSTAGTIRGLEFIRCRLESAEAALYVTAAANGCTGLRAVDNEVSNDSTNSLGQGGFLVDLGTAAGEPTEWTVRGNRCKQLRGEGVYAWALQDSWLVDNYIQVVTDHSCIRVGNTGTRSDTARVIVRDNICRQDGGATAPVVRLLTAGDGTVHANILVHDNIVDGTDTPAGSVGIYVEASDVDVARGVLVHSNVVQNVEKGIDIDAVESAVVHSNAVVAGAACIEVAPGVSDTDGVVIGMNAVKVTADGGIGIDLQNATGSTQLQVVIGNSIDITDGGTAPAGFRSSTTNELECSTIVGNAIRGNGAGHLAIQLDDVSGTAIVGNATQIADSEAGTMSQCAWIGNVTPSSTLTVPTASGCVVSGNISSTMTFNNAPGCVFAENNLSNSLLPGGAGSIIACCLINGDLDLDTPTTPGTRHVVVGCVVDRTLNEDATTDDCVVVGNRFPDTSATHSLGQPEGTWVANRYADNVTLEATVNGGLFVGNQVDGVLTNSSVGSTVASNEN